MDVKSLLALAAECETEDDAERLLDTLIEAFNEALSVSHLPQFNTEFYMEEGKPFVRFELNKLISEHYVTMIRPEIRDGELVVDVVTNHMLDGLGLSSQSWEAEDGMDDTIKPDEDLSIADLAERAKQLAIANHAELIERVGVPRAVAKDAAEKSW